jgi:hypothetical protein
MTLLPLRGAATISVPFRYFRPFRRDIAFQMPQASLSVLSNLSHEIMPFVAQPHPFRFFPFFPSFPTRLCLSDAAGIPFCSF